MLETDYLCGSASFDTCVAPWATLRRRAEPSDRARRRRDGYVDRFLRLAALCPGLWICPTAGDGFESQADCQHAPTLRRIFGWPNEAVLKGYYDADIGEGKQFRAALKKHGVVLSERYPYKNKPLGGTAYFNRLPGEPVYDTPADQMAEPFDAVFPAAVLLEIRTGVKSATALAAPNASTETTPSTETPSPEALSPETYRNAPYDVTIPVLIRSHDGDDAPPLPNVSPLTDAEEYAVVSCLRRKRKHDSVDGVMSFGVKFSRGGPSSVRSGDTRPTRPGRPDAPRPRRPRRSRAASRLSAPTRLASSKTRRRVRLRGEGGWSWNVGT